MHLKACSKVAWIKFILVGEKIGVVVIYCFISKYDQNVTVTNNTGTGHDKSTLDSFSKLALTLTLLILKELHLIVY